MDRDGGVLLGKERISESFSECQRVSNVDRVDGGFGESIGGFGFNDGED